MPKCKKCGRQFKPGDDVFEDETKRIDVKGNEAKTRLVMTYTCAPKCKKEE